MNQEQREKYSRQILFAGLGEVGQEKLLESSAVLVGCGALGTVAANLLVRAGVGRLRIIDRDFVELSNLQRQTLLKKPMRGSRCRKPWPLGNTCGRSTAIPISKVSLRT